MIRILDRAHSVFGQRPRWRDGRRRIEAKVSGTGTAAFFCQPRHGNLGNPSRMPGKANVVGNVSALRLRDAPRTTSLSAVEGIKTRVGGKLVITGGAKRCVGGSSDTDAGKTAFVEGWAIAASDARIRGPTRGGSRNVGSSRGRFGQGGEILDGCIGDGCWSRRVDDGPRRRRCCSTRVSRR